MRTSLTLFLLIPLTTVSPFAFTSSPSISNVYSPVNNKKRASIILGVAKFNPKKLFNLGEIEKFEKTLNDNDVFLNDVLEYEEVEYDANESEEELGDGNNEVMLEISESYDNQRIDAVLTSLLPLTENSSGGSSKISRSACVKLISNKNVFLLQKKGGQQVYTPITQKAFKVTNGMALKVLQTQNDDHVKEIVKEDIPLDVLFEDEHIIVINKSSNMVVHPSLGNWNGTLVNALAYYLSNVSPFDNKEEFTDVVIMNNTLQQQQQQQQMPSGDGQEPQEKKNEIYNRPGIVHRLDKGTTGVIIIAKTKQTLATLSKSFANRQVKKTYLAIAIGNPGTKVKIDKRIRRHPIHRQKMMVVPDVILNNYKMQGEMLQATTAVIGRRALSFVDTLATNGKLSVAYVRIQTGRTHQIRVHLQDRHTPIYGDEIYGIASWNRKLSKELKLDSDTNTRPLLHAHKLEIDHPITGERMVFTAPMPNDMSNVANTIWPTGKMEYPLFFTKENS